MKIVHQVAREHLLTIDELRGPLKGPRYVLARIAAARRLIEERKLSTGVVGRLLGRSTWTIKYYTAPPTRSRHCRLARKCYSEAA
jgi:hypothetical protein